MTELTRVRDYFAGSAPVGLILPDGWFGRPYDNMLRHTSTTFEAGVLTVRLDVGELRLTGDVHASVDDDSLTLSDSTELVWSWTPYGSDTRRDQTYTTGAVRFVRF